MPRYVGHKPRKYLELAAPDLENSAPRTVGENGRHCRGADGCVDLSPPKAPLQQQIPSPGASRVSPNPPPWKRKNLSLAISMREAPRLRINENRKEEPAWRHHGFLSSQQSLLWAPHRGWSARRRQRSASQSASASATIPSGRKGRAPVLQHRGSERPNGVEGQRRF